MDQNSFSPDQAATFQHGPGSFGGGFWIGHIIEGLVGFLIVGALIALGIWALRRFLASRSPLATLDMRLARGEVDYATYQTARQALIANGHTPAEAPARAESLANPPVSDASAQPSQTIWSTEAPSAQASTSAAETETIVTDAAPAVDETTTLPSDSSKK